MSALQLDFFLTEEECEMQQIREQVAALKASQDKVRKALFARHGELIKGVIDLNERVEHIERGLCREVK